MRLLDLWPRWIHPNIFAFLCPHCREVFLTCKDAILSMSDQYETCYEDQEGFNGVTVVLCKAEMAWNIQGRDFATLTVTPSLDASASGHWHGFIREGAIV